MFQSKIIVCLLLLATSVVGAAANPARNKEPQSVVYDQSQNGRENFFFNIKNVHVAILPASKETNGGLFPGSLNKPSYFDSIKDSVLTYLYQLQPQPQPAGGLYDEYFKPEFEEPTVIEFETSGGEHFGDEEIEKVPETSTETTTEASTTEIPTIVLTLDGDQIVQNNRKNSTVVTNLIPESFSEKIKELLNMDTPKPPKMRPTEKPGLEIIETIKRKTTTVKKDQKRFL